MASPFTCCPVNRECHVKENPDGEKKIIFLLSKVSRYREFNNLKKASIQNFYTVLK